MSESTGADRRKYPRLNAPVYFRSSRFVFQSRRSLVDVSRGGARIYCDELVKVGHRLDLELFLSDDSTLQCTARVAWVDELPTGAEAAYEVGLEFENLTPDIKSRLELVLDHEAGS